jgi:aspartate aminotransferase
MSLTALDKLAAFVTHSETTLHLRQHVVSSASRRLTEPLAAMDSTAQLSLCDGVIMSSSEVLSPAPNKVASGLFASRVTRIAPSVSGAAAQRARELLAAGRSIVNLTAGEPDFDTPQNIRQAAVAAINRGETRYTTVDGTQALKDAVITKFARENRLHFARDQVTVGSGAKQIIFNAFLASIEDGDEAVIPTPSWVSYPEMVRLAGGKPVLVPCDEARGFKIKPEQLEAALTARTKWLVLNSPSNPTGAIYSAAELRALGEVLAAHPHVWVMSDDIYEHIVFDTEPFSTMAQAVPALADRTLTINGVSKAYAMTGWRIGYAGGPSALISEMSKIQSQSTSNPCSISQAASIEALLGPQDFIAKNAAEFGARRDLVVSELSSIPGLTCAEPAGAFYVFPSCKTLIGKRTPEGQRIENDRAFVAYLLECGVAAVGGHAYGLSPHFRLSIATSREQLAEGCRRIREACAKLRD